MKPPERRGVLTADLTWTPEGPAGRRCGWSGWWSRAAGLAVQCDYRMGSSGPVCAQSPGAGPWSWNWVRCWIFSSWQCHRRHSWTGSVSASGRPLLLSLSDWCRPSSGPGRRTSGLELHLIEREKGGNVIDLFQKCTRDLEQYNSLCSRLTVRWIHVGILILLVLYNSPKLNNIASLYRKEKQQILSETVKVWHFRHFQGHYFHILGTLVLPLSCTDRTKLVINICDI